MPATSDAGIEGRLFQPVTLGRYRLRHRMVMAPLTRSRARQPGNVPTPLNAAYYAQRASAALIISEATQVSMQGQGYAWTPGIHSREQIEGWRLVTGAVHGAGGLIFMQLWHVGRISHPLLQPDRMLPVAPSAIRPSGEAFIENDRGEGELVPFVTPRALQIEEMPYLVQQYARGARNALEAGFDGVEVHAANGYLLDQFLNSRTNQRSDGYGGSVAEPRAPAAGGGRGGDRGVGRGPRRRAPVAARQPSTTSATTIPRRPSAMPRAGSANCGLAYLHIVNPATAALEQGTEPDPTSIADGRADPAGVPRHADRRRRLRPGQRRGLAASRARRT